MKIGDKVQIIKGDFENHIGIVDAISLNDLVRVYSEGHFQVWVPSSDLKEVESMERIVRVWIGNDYIDYEIEDNGGLTEDELYEKAVDEVFSIISIEIL